MSKYLQPSRIELSESALKKNLDFLRKEAGSGVLFSSVIKGNAYGHGTEYFIPMAEQCGVNHFSVFSADEAEVALNSVTQPDTRIMIMGMISDEAVDWAVDHGIEFYVFEKGRLESALRAAKKLNKKARIHLEVETGMHRTGIEKEELDSVIEVLNNNRAHLILRGVCTHFAGAESVANYLRIQQQKESFIETVKKIKSEYPGKFLVHAASSAALLTYPDTIFDMVRVGIAQYGFWPTRETYMQLRKSLRADGMDPLKRVISWKSTVMNTKWVDEGEFIGYGTAYLTNRKTRLATVPIGYTHGFARSLTNAGYVLIGGERVNVIGIVNMNMITVDVTDVPSVQKGDEVVIIGTQGKQEITIASFGEMTNNLNYEVLTRLARDLPRVIVK
jgi:alanine racemase